MLFAAAVGVFGAGGGMGSAAAMVTGAAYEATGAPKQHLGVFIGLVKMLENLVTMASPLAMGAFADAYSVWLLGVMVGSLGILSFFCERTCCPDGWLGCAFELRCFWWLQMRSGWSR